MTYFEAPESVKYHGGYDPSDPPQYDEDEDSSDGETSGEDVVCAASPAPSLQSRETPDLNSGTLAESNKQAHPSCSGCAQLLLRYPVWDLTFSEYGNLNGWEIPQ
jgi:hypothetical protein